MKRFFTFGAGDKFIEASRRLIVQAERTNIFDEVVSYTDEDLKSTKDFWANHGDFISNNPRMYGYGIWKPYLVLKELEGLDDGDTLFYADSGCEFDFDCENPKEAYDNIVPHLKDHKIIGTLCNWDKNMNKMDLINHLDMSLHPGLMTEQIQATTFLIEKCDRTMLFVKDWYDTCCHYHLINDSPSVSANRDDYDEHRHEQSVFSLLLKKHNLYNLPNQVTLESIICMSRNRSGIHFPACRVTGSNFYSLHFGDDFIEGNQIIQMSNLIRKYNPQYILETGFGSGRTAATMIQSCRKLPILKYVNVDRNYNLYYPFSIQFRKYYHDMCPFFESHEKRSSELLRAKFLKSTFPEGIDWYTVDGDPTYEGVLCELISVFPHMKSGGVIYIVSDRLKIKNFNTRDATDLFYETFKGNLTKRLDDVMGREICHLIVSGEN